MRRVNKFEVRPLRKRDRLLLLEVLDASASLWNEITYKRRQAFFAGEDVWDRETGLYRDKYKGTLGAAAVQQIIRRNDEAWRGFFGLLEAGEDPDPPGYRKDNGQRELRTLVRNDQYTLQWGDRSRLEIPVGLTLKEKYGLGYNERLRLEVRGDPRWRGKQGRLELVYERDTDSFRAYQPVNDAVRRRKQPLATASSDDDEVAALDIGANNLVAVTTTRGAQRLYHGRPQFHRFHRTTKRIAKLQSLLGPDEWTSRQLRQLYRRRSARRNHMQDALVRNLAEWLRDHDIGEVIIGDLDSLTPYWCTRVNEKVHLFWAYGRFQRRLQEVLSDEYGIDVREVDESGSSSQCPRCGERNVTRSEDTLHCVACDFEGHSDLAGSENILREYTDRSMARPAVPDQNRSGKGHHEVPCLEWDDHRWQHRDQLTKENPANRSTRKENLASGGAEIT